MNWLETIELRSIEENRKSLESQMVKLINEVNREARKQAIKVYSSMTINTDFCIHLFHESKKAEVNGSRLGLRLASALKAFGLVNYSIWIEIGES